MKLYMYKSSTSLLMPQTYVAHFATSLVLCHVMTCHGAVLIVELDFEGNHAYAVQNTFLVDSYAK